MIDADVKVVIITGLDPDEERLPGVAKILAKPFRPAQVVDAVQGRDWDVRRGGGTDCPAA